MGGWVLLALRVLDLVNKFLQWIEREKITNEAEKAALAAAAEAINVSVAKADAARARVRDELADPDKLRDDSSGPWRD